MEEEVKVKRLLLVLARAKGPVTIDYLIRYTNLDRPQDLLEKLEEKGLVKKIKCSEWSPCMNPLYQITSDEKVYDLFAGFIKIDDLL
ncbi:MAG: helix-turn-helix domain-containing protein [Nitrososphaeria archaeon]